MCKFRHLLERNGMGKVLLEAMNTYLRENGVRVGTGTIVDATIISAPSSTKNRTANGTRRCTRRPRASSEYFGMKAHLGVDSQTKVIHTIKASAANVADRDALAHLLHGKETRVWGDQPTRARGDPAGGPARLDFTNRLYRHNGVIDEAQKARN
ncbi:MAG: transposase [Gammaproteobacteria bacterium]